MEEKNIEWFIGYFPNLGLLHATLDLNTYTVDEAVEELYERVQKWTSEKRVILREGTVKSVPVNRVETPPDFIMLRAPVIDPGSLSTDTAEYGIYES